jgi:ABC-type phosphate transport system substrate-binding protein
MTIVHRNRSGSSRSRSLGRALAALGAVVVGTTLWLGISPCWADDFVFIKNAKNGAAKISKAEVKNVFTGRTKTWSDVGVVTVVLGPEDSPQLAWLADKVFQVAPKTMLTKIKQEVFKGEMKKPITAASPAEALEAVRNNPGAIAVVPADAAKALPAGVALLPLGD